MNQQIEQLYDPIFFFIKKRINSKEDAEDLTQEVFYKLAKSDPTKINNLTQWIYAISKNAVTDYYRKHKIITSEIEDLPVEESEDNMATEELSQCVVPFIKELPEEYHQLLTLSEIENLSQKEIAEKLDMNYVTVRSKIQRGRKKLKSVFTDCCDIIQGGKGSIMDYTEINNCDSSC